MALSASPGTAAVRQRPYRQKTGRLVYVTVDQANGGIIRDVSGSGVAVQAIAPLQVNQLVRLRFELSSPRLRVETAGRVAWADSMGQAGLQFLALPRNSHRQLKEWLFIQLLATAHQVAWDSIFVQDQRGEGAAELRFSTTSRPPIRLETEEVTASQGEQGEVQQELVSLLGFRLPISPRTLSRLVDILILLCAVLLFYVLSLALTHASPAWPLALGLATGAAGVFVAVYWLMFVFGIGRTPGMYLAQFIAAKSGGSSLAEEDRARFR